MSIDTPIWHIIWSTYGSWLPGNEKGWTKRTLGPCDPDAPLHAYMEGLLKQPTFTLLASQRRCCLGAIRREATYRGAQLFGVNVRSNHVHVLVQSSVDGPGQRARFKAWSTRALREAGLVGSSGRVWAAGGYSRMVKNVRVLDALVRYVIEGQGENVEGAYYHPKFE